MKTIIRYQNKDNNKLLELSLLVATNDNHPTIRIEALKGLAKIQSARSIPRIKEIALKDINDNVRWYAIQALATYRDPTLIQTFMKGYQDDDWLIKEASILGLMSIDDKRYYPEIIPYIINALKLKNEGIKAKVLTNITIQDPLLYEEITRIFHETEKTRYTMLAASLKALKGYKLDEKTREKVINLLVNSTRNIRLLSLKVLKAEKK